MQKSIAAGDPVTDEHNHGAGVKHALTLEQIELMKGPALADLLPINVATKDLVNEIKLQCALCNEDIPDVLTRGRIQRPTPNVVVLEAGCYCERCEAFGVQRFRFYDDGRSMFFNGKVWKQFDATPPSVWKRSQAWLAKHL
jgi:hypothetical protein